MDERVRQIEAHIDQTRERLGANLDELEHRVDAATDWREQFRARPYVALGVAAAGGALFAAVLQRSQRSPRGASTPYDAPIRAASPIRAGSRSGAQAKQQAIDFWERLQDALVGVATTRLRQYVGEFVPGFDEHYRRAEQRIGPSNPAPAGVARS